jgi:cytochrome c oxidase subunit 2
MRLLAVPNRRLRSLLRTGAPLVLIALLAGCMIPPEPETKEAESVFTLYNIIFAMGVVVFVAIEGFIVYAIFRYRRRDDTLPHQLHGNNFVEILWTAIPTVIVLILFTLNLFTLNTVNATSESPGVNVEVDGFQWQWGFHYLDGDDNPDNDVSLIGTPGEPPVLRLPVGEPIHLTLISKDVIHSFFVPSFLVKRDVIPFPEGQEPNHLEFTITNPGTYAGHCAEFCGTGHANMLFSVEAMSRADFDKWISDQKSQASATPAPSVAPGETVIKLSAEKLAFSTKTLEVPAGKPFVIEFENKDSGIAHNVAILDGNTALFTGEVITGPKTVQYQVPALKAGQYKFLCDVHPTVMFGDVVAK